MIKAQVQNQEKDKNKVEAIRKVGEEVNREDIIKTEKSHVYLIRDWCLSYESLAHIYEECDKLPWIKHKVRVMGKLLYQPRHSCIVSYNSVEYKYAGTSHPANDIENFPFFKNVINIVNEELGTDFNSILFNMYKDGKEYICAHSDDERGLSNSIVAGISLGAERTFRFRNKSTGEKVDVEMPDGCLFVMDGETQKEWTHELPKRLRVKNPRISLTFRTHIV